MNKVTPQQAAEQVANENHITIVFENGFEEDSQTAKEFENEIYGVRFEDACVNALLGGEYRYETFLSNYELEKNAILDIVRYGDWSYIILHDQTHPTDSNLYVVIVNSEQPN